MQLYSQRIIKEQLIHCYHQNAHINMVIHLYEKFITELQKSLNITTLFVTHDQIEAIELADHIGVMFAGEMVQYGTPEEIFNHPKNPEIADFMGATNLIHGVVHSNKDNRVSVAIGNEIIQLNKSSNMLGP